MRDRTQPNSQGGSLGNRADSWSSEFASIAKLRTELENTPSVKIERAAELLGVSVRTLYRRRYEFEHRRQGGHLYFTLRSLRQHVIQQYHPTTSFDLTISDSFDNCVT